MPRLCRFINRHLWFPDYFQNMSWFQNQNWRTWYTSSFYPIKEPVRAAWPSREFLRGQRHTEIITQRHILHGSILSQSEMRPSSLYPLNLLTWRMYEGKKMQRQTDLNPSFDQPYFLKLLPTGKQLKLVLTSGGGRLKLLTGLQWCIFWLLQWTLPLAVMPTG